MNMTPSKLGCSEQHVCQRMQVWMALLEKGIDFDVVFIQLYNKPDWCALCGTASVHAAG